MIRDDYGRVDHVQVQLDHDLATDRHVDPDAAEMAPAPHGPGQQRPRRLSRELEHERLWERGFGRAPA